MSQSAHAQGQGNVIVQILGDGNVATVSGAVALRLTRYGQAAYAAAPAQAEKMGEPGFTPSGRSVLRVLSPHNRASLPFQGREETLVRLKAWLAAPGRVSVQAVIGGGGRGKTRLAAEIAAWAAAQGWIAGFARRDDLDVFRGAGCRTTWYGPCLVIVDYAAAKAAELGAWLRSLAHLDEEGPPLRLLLLERTGGGGSAWWRRLFEQAGVEGEQVAGLLGAGAPLTLGALSGPVERHTVFAAAYGQATSAAPPPRDPWLDQALVEASLGGEPLFLAMFGLVAAQQGFDQARRDQEHIAARLAQQELKRIEQHWRSHGLCVGAEHALHAHLAAVATMCEGLTEDESHDTIARESRALHQEIRSGQTEPARAALYSALPGEANGLAPILPDVLGEAVILEAFSRQSVGIGAFNRAMLIAGDRVQRVIFRASLDYPNHRFPRDCMALLPSSRALRSRLDRSNQWLNRDMIKRIKKASGDETESINQGSDISVGRSR